MIPGAVSVSVFGLAVRPAAVRPRVVGDPRPTPYDAAAVNALDASAGSWWGLRSKLVQPLWWRKRQDGAAGFFSSDQVFPGLS